MKKPSKPTNPTPRQPLQLRTTITDAQIIGEQQREIRQLKEALDTLGNLYQNLLEQHNGSKSNTPTQG